MSLSNKPAFRVCNEKPNCRPAITVDIQSETVEVVDVERFPEGDGDLFQISHPTSQNWLLVNRKFLEVCAKMLKLEPGSSPTSLDSDYWKSL